MLYYEILVQTKNNTIDSIIQCNQKESEEKDKITQAIRSMNLFADIGITIDENAYLLFTEMTDNSISAISIIPPDRQSYTTLLETVEQILNRVHLSENKIKTAEITLKEFESKLNRARDAGYTRNHARTILSDLKLDYNENRTFTLKQSLIAKEKLSYDDAVKQAGALMGSNAFVTELERIYSPDHPKNFFGHPVHYKIQAAELDAAYAMAELLIQSLYSNGRLQGRRIEKISKITDNCYDEDDMRNLCYHAQGGTVIMELFGNTNDNPNYASRYEQVVIFFDELVKKYNHDVLFIFIELSSKPGLAKKFTSRFLEDIDIITIEEGKGDKNVAETYLAHLIEQSDLAKYKDTDSEELKLDDKTYTVSDIYRIFNKWSRDSLKYRVYTAYRNCQVTKKETEEKGNAYEKLQKLVGLSDVKEIVDQIIAAYQMQKIKSGYFSEKQQTSKHMIFTGNPGSAKTTVARLLAQILKENGVLETGEYVECGRADLVDRYVGWTAKSVRAKFRQAQGGVLFIDEAYSLVDDAGSFGDEAINTIVQEMENHRDDVIVIFAGYPSKMKEFFAKNEGLRSRIAFHVHFPDYTKQELMEIMDVMLKDMGYSVSRSAREKASVIFEKAVHIPEFGNGRLVRNMLEQATMKQASRLYQSGFEDETNQQVLFSLDETDFELPSLLPKTERKTRIGFSMECD